VGAEVIGGTLDSVSRQAEVRRKILHVSTRFIRGGAERNMATLIAWERSRGHEVHVAVGEALDGSLPPGTHVHAIEHLGRRVRLVSDLRAIFELRSLIHSGHFDVVHTHESKAGALGRLAARGSNAVVIHTVHMPSFGFAYGRFRSRAFRAVERFCARTTHIFVVVGDELRDLYLAAGIGRADQYLALRSPIQVDRFARLRDRAPSTVRKARVDLRLDPNIPVAITVGRLERRKRQALIIDQLRDILIAQRIQLVIIGDGPEETRLRQLALRYGLTETVFFLGYLDVLDDAFLAADVLIHASRVEGVPQVVLQALAAGIPVIATSVEGLAEVDGAPITRVDREGRSLRKAVEDALQNPPPPVPVGSLAAWCGPAILRSIEALDARVGSFAQARMT
jgi:glycosyltransferase involved in cell wall biosynthesis